MVGVADAVRNLGFDPDCRALGSGARVQGRESLSGIRLTPSSTQLHSTATTTAMRMSTVTELALPAVTVCNLPGSVPLRSTVCASVSHLPFSI